MQKTGRGLSSFSIDALIGHSKCLDAPSQGCGFEPREPVIRGDRDDLQPVTDHHSPVVNTPPCKVPPSSADLELHAFRLYRPPPPSTPLLPSAKVDIELRRCINSSALSTEPMRKYCGGWAELLAKHNLQTSVLASATDQRWGPHPSQHSHRRRFDGLRDASVEQTTMQRHSLLSSSHYLPVQIPASGESQTHFCVYIWSIVLNSVVRYSNRHKMAACYKRSANAVCLI